MTQFFLIRHGQSTSNAGHPSVDTRAVSLTELGERQAAAASQVLADIGAPSLIVASPYLRAQQTAAPTRAHFPAVPFETWPIQEFTYLHFPGETVYSERLPKMNVFWETGDADSRAAHDLESFNDLIGRVDDCVRRLKSCNLERVFLFAHCRYIQVFIWRWLVRSDQAASHSMTTFWNTRHLIRIPNLGYVQGVVKDDTLSLFPIETLVGGELTSPRFS